MEGRPLAANGWRVRPRSSLRRLDPVVRLEARPAPATAAQAPEFRSEAFQGPLKRVIRVQLQIRLAENDSGPVMCLERGILFRYMAGAEGLICRRTRRCWPAAMSRETGRRRAVH